MKPFATLEKKEREAVKLRPTTKFLMVKMKIIVVEVVMNCHGEH
jgi:hypothetical protein